MSRPGAPQRPGTVSARGKGSTRRGGLPRAARIAFLVVFVYLFVSLSVQMIDVFRMRHLVQELDAQLAALRVDNERLTQEIAFVKTDQYVQQVAREELGLVWPNEIPYARGVRLGP